MTDKIESRILKAGAVILITCGGYIVIVSPLTMIERVLYSICISALAFSSLIIALKISSRGEDKGNP